MQPQFQYQAWENGAIRFGYRKLAYDIDTKGGNNFDIAFSGPFIGVGLTFGSAPKAAVSEVSQPIPAPIAAANGSSINYACAAPASKVASNAALLST